MELQYVSCVSLLLQVEISSLEGLKKGTQHVYNYFPDREHCEQWMWVMCWLEDTSQQK